MYSRASAIVLVFGAWALAWVTSPPATAQAAGAEQDFRAGPGAVLEARCLECHGGGKRVRGGLRMTSAESFRAGGDSGPVVEREAPERSLLLAMVRWVDEDHQMPPKGKLPEEELAVLESWVLAGASWPEGVELGAGMVVEEAPAAPAPASPDPMRGWSYRPLARPAVPVVADAAWVRTPIDAFVLARLEAAGLTPAPQADRLSLIRRVTYDLTGLPPTPEEVDAFLGDERPDAWERLVERLLASPHYGEQWGRHWLDLVRYAETNGYERDSDKPYMWRYRDWVIEAFNADMPYDRFVIEQLAGDELEQPTPGSRTATGYLRLMVWDDEPPQGPLQARYDALDDVCSTTAGVFLGLSLGCARCHEHKKDPIPQADYYRFMAFFHGLSDWSVEGTLGDVASAEEHAERQAREAERKLEEARLEAAIGAAEIRFREQSAGRLPPALEGAQEPSLRERMEAHAADYLTAEEVERWRAAWAALEQLRAHPLPEKLAPVAREGGPQPAELFVHMRGNPAVPGERVEPALPACLNAAPLTIPPAPEGAASSGRRLALARWIASRENALAPRLIANRVWQFHFGRGIVRSANDFGELGERPTHPELLDWLACELVARGYSLRELHRLILASSVYRMSSAAEPRALEQDPTNDLYWRYDLRRLSAEELRDSALAVSGELNPAMGGPSVYVPMPEEVLATSSRPHDVWGRSAPEDELRRSLYIKVKRSLVEPLLARFDLADTDSSCPARFTTTQPSQALALWNGDFFHERARALARRLEREAGAEAAARVRLALRLASGREPGAAELDEECRFLSELEHDFGLSPELALERYCLLTLNRSEFLYLD